MNSPRYYIDVGGVPRAILTTILSGSKVGRAVGGDAVVKYFAGEDPTDSSHALLVSSF